MTPEYAIQLGQDSLMTVLYVAGPLLIVALVVGLGVSIFQAVTQVHEMTLTFIPKILSVGATIFILLPWTLLVISEYTREVFLKLHSVMIP